MKVLSRILSAILVVCLTAAVAGCATGEPGADSSAAGSSAAGSSAAGSSPVGSSAADSSATGSSPASSGAIASADQASSGAAASPSEATVSLPTTGTVDVDAHFAASGKTMLSDVSSCFPATADGYLINGGTAEKPYLVNADTLFRLTEKPVSGSGYVKWVGFNKSINNTVNPDPFTGVVPVSKLHDPIYMSVCLPSEADTYMTRRINASNLYPTSVTTAGKHTEAHLIGAVYLNENNKPKDTDTVTVCISDFRLLYHSNKTGFFAKTGWFAAESTTVPTLDKVNHMFFLPWQLNASYVVNDYVSFKSDHVEIALTGALFNGTSPAIIDADGKVRGSDGKKYPNGKLPITRSGSVVYDGTLEEVCFHFWGKGIKFSDHGLNDTNIDGMVSAFRIWIKVPEMSGKFVAAIGIDLNDANGATDQSYSGRNYLITDKPQWIIGHNVGPKAYDSIMETDKVRQLIGLN